MMACFEGNTVQIRDVEQAYLQAEMEGPPVYVSLPEELWTDGMWYAGWKRAWFKALLLRVWHCFCRPFCLCRRRLGPSYVFMKERET